MMFVVVPGKFECGRVQGLVPLEKQCVGELATLTYCLLKTFW